MPKEYFIFGDAFNQKFKCRRQHTCEKDKKIGALNYYQCMLSNIRNQQRNMIEPYHVFPYLKVTQAVKIYLICNRKS